MLLWVGVFLAAAVAGLVGTWAVRRAAPWAGLVDKPDGVRKLQRQPVPVGGGLAVFAAALGVSVLAVLLLPEPADEFALNPRPWLALMAAAAVIVLVGIIDDRVALRARNKLLGQFAAVGVLIFVGGVTIDRIHLLGMVIPLGWAAVPVTAFWLLAAVNALNLLDGMDGLLGTVGLIGCLALGAVAGLSGNVMAGVVALAVAGGLAGFLRFNLPPASIYCGDCGSMLVGLTAGAVAVMGSMKSHAFALGVPAAVLVLPFLDTSAAIVRRKLSGRGMAVPDRDHLHHVLLRNGMTVPQALLLLGGLGAVGATGGLAGWYFRTDAIAVVTGIGVVLILLAAGLFGMAEVKLMQERAVAALRAAGRATRRRTPDPTVRPVPPVRVSG